MAVIWYSNIASLRLLSPMVVHLCVCLYVCNWDINEGYRCMGTFTKCPIVILTLGSWHDARGTRGK